MRSVRIHDSNMREIAEKIRDGLPGKTSVVFMGQAGFVIKSSKGKMLAVDLYLSNAGEQAYGFKRLMPYLLDPREIVFDIVVCTHEHYDHFDYDAMPELLASKKTKLVAAKDCKKLLNMLGLLKDDMFFLSTGQSVEICGFDISAVYCDHGPETPDAIGLVIKVDEKKIYISGDTCLRIDKAEEIKECGPFDIMIAPINGAFGNMNELEMVKLCSIIEPTRVIPCHYWNFAEHGGNPGVFAEELRKQLPKQDYYFMRLGEMLEI